MLVHCVCCELPVCGHTSQCVDLKIPPTHTHTVRQQNSAELKYLITIHRYNSNLTGRLKANTSVTTSFILPVFAVIPVLEGEQSAKSLLKQKDAFLLSWMNICPSANNNTTSIPYFRATGRNNGSEHIHRMRILASLTFCQIQFYVIYSYLTNILERAAILHTHEVINKAAGHKILINTAVK